MPEAAISTQQSEAEYMPAGSALTLGQDQILSGKQVEVWSGSTTKRWRESWLDLVLGELRELLTLAPGWDSYGGAALDAKVAASAIDILNVLAREQKPRPRLVPTS